MTINRTLRAALILAGAATLSAGANASAADSDTFINPDWANTAWYAGASLGQARATIDRQRIGQSLTANGATLTSMTTDERALGYSLFLGKQLNRNFAIEAGYFDLGKFSVDAITSGNGTFRGEAGFKGGNVDLVGQYPLTERFSLLGRVGMQYKQEKRKKLEKKTRGKRCKKNKKKQKWLTKTKT